MQNPISGGNREKNSVLGYLLLFATVVLITLIIPKTGHFRYEFDKGKVWRHEDLQAPFAFAIRKTEEELKLEEKELRTNFRPFYARDAQVAGAKKDQFINLFTLEAEKMDSLTQDERKFYLSRGLQILDEIYSRGIIKLDTAHEAKSKAFIITELQNSVGTDKQLLNYYTLPEARSSIMDRVQSNDMLNKSWFIRPLISALEPNVAYESNLSQKKLEELISSISPTRGMVQLDEKIVSRGSVVNDERYRMLYSLKQEYEAKQQNEWLLMGGYFLLVLVVFFMYAIQLDLFHKNVLQRIRGLVLIIMHILIFTALTAYIVEYEQLPVHVIPYTIVPIVLLAFFGVRIAILTHLVVVMVCALMVPNPYAFVLLQLTAGFTAVLSMARIRYISQFFISALLILLSYTLIYLGLNLIRTGFLSEIELSDFMWFGANFILTLLAYPLIYVNEKIFGFLSDISLLELSDINNKLLKQLFMRAPGTFQHSLQVANLAEAVIERIGGNALLTRVGALYHDIGKIENPEYFIENQKMFYNPHENLTDLQSADIIIGHVTKGVEFAQEYHLPKNVVDFIRTHHGTTRVEYFFNHYVKEHPDEEVDESVFRYPGPKPFSKETAVVMIADSIEAASRSLKDPDEKVIDDMIDRIIDRKIQDNQFEYASITIQEINAARRILKKLVKSIYHIRIKYPSEVGEKQEKAAE